MTLSRNLTPEASRFWSRIVGLKGVVAEDQEDPNEYIEVEFSDGGMFPALAEEIELVKEDK